MINISILVTVFFISMTSCCYGADTKLSEIAEDTNPAADSLIYTVDDPGGTPTEKRSTLGNLSKGIVHDDTAGITGTAGQYNHPTDADMTVLGNTSNTNTGDNTVATSGDSATSFFISGTIEHERGGLEADVSGYNNGLYGQLSNATENVDTLAELNTAIGDATVLSTADVDDTPVDGATTAPSSSNRMFDHETEAISYEPILTMPMHEIWAAQDALVVGTSIEAIDGGPAPNTYTGDANSYPGVVGTTLGLTIDNNARAASRALYEENPADEDCITSQKWRSLTMNEREAQAKMDGASDGEMYCVSDNAACSAACDSRTEAIIKDQSYENLIQGLGGAFDIFWWGHGHNDRSGCSTKLDYGWGTLNPTEIVVTNVQIDTPSDGFTTISLTPGHSVIQWDDITFRFGVGMDELNYWTGEVNSVTPTINDIVIEYDTTGFTAYTSGGTVVEYQKDRYYDAANMLFNVALFENPAVRTFIVNPPTIYHSDGDPVCMNEIRLANFELAEKWDYQIYDMSTDLGLTNDNRDDWFSDQIHPVDQSSRDMMAEHVSKWLNGNIQFIESSAKAYTGSTSRADLESDHAAASNDGFLALLTDNRLFVSDGTDWNFVKQTAPYVFFDQFPTNLDNWDSSWTTYQTPTIVSGRVFFDGAASAPGDAIQRLFVTDDAFEVEFDCEMENASAGNLTVYFLSEDSTGLDDEDLYVSVNTGSSIIRVASHQASQGSTYIADYAWTDDTDNHTYNFVVDLKAGKFSVYQDTVLILDQDDDAQILGNYIKEIKQVVVRASNAGAGNGAYVDNFKLIQ